MQRDRRSSSLFPPPTAGGPFRRQPPVVPLTAATSPGRRRAACTLAARLRWAILPAARVGWHNALRAARTPAACSGARGAGRWLPHGQSRLTRRANSRDRARSGGDGGLMGVGCADAEEVPGARLRDLWRALRRPCANRIRCVRPPSEAAHPMNGLAFSKCRPVVLSLRLKRLNRKTIDS